MARLLGCLMLAAGLAVAGEAPEKLTGAELETLLRLRAEAAEARVAHLALEMQARERGQAAQAAVERLEAFATQKAGDSGCVLQADGGWQCPPKAEAKDEGGK